MPIKAGQLMAAAPGQLRTLISDGKRLRVLWADGDGDGEPSAHIIERCHNTVKGHPTWKVFCGEVDNPLERDKNEPPHYAYLDDQACYLIWSSQKYTKQELKEFWPFDFDSSGKIKTGRANRGRPAHVSRPHTEYAKAPLRGKNKTYEFRGAPDWSSAPVKEEEPSIGSVEMEQDNTVSSAPPNIAESPQVPVNTTTPTPAISSVGDPMTSPAHTFPTRPDWGLGNGRVPFAPSDPTRYVSGPIDGSLRPVGMAHKAVQGSPYFEIPAAAFRSRPRPRGGDLGVTLGVVPTRKTTETPTVARADKAKVVKAMKKKVPKTSVSKGRDGLIQSLATGSLDAGDGSTSAKKVKMEDQQEEHIPTDASSLE
jgi:hypothetical protein